MGPRAAERQRGARSDPTPAPFAKVTAPALLSFVEELDKEKVYITSVDTQPASFKKQAFAVPVVLNLVLGLLLIWRAYAILPTYWSYILTILGNKTEHWVDQEKTTGWELFAIIMQRFAVILFDYVLISVILPWPVSFFFELPANPCIWRWKVPFKDQEITVRKSRHWDRKDLVGAEKKGSESPFWVTRIQPAVSKTLIRSKTGYVLMGKDWNLSFEDMIWAENLVRAKKAALADFRTKVLVHMEDLGWLFWTADWEEESSTDEEASRQKIVAFKDNLTALGKESLFFRWIELLQYQTSLPGGFTPARRQETLDKARQMFENQGIDFDEFAKSIGGLEGLPGMEEES